MLQLQSKQLSSALKSLAEEFPVFNEKVESAMQKPFEFNQKTLNFEFLQKRCLFDFCAVKRFKKFMQDKIIFLDQMELDESHCDERGKK